jgi:hypothetical protein
MPARQYLSIVCFAYEDKLSPINTTLGPAGGEVAFEAGFVVAGLAGGLEVAGLVGDLVGDLLEPSAVSPLHSLVLVHLKAFLNKSVLHSLQ